MLPVNGFRRLLDHPRAVAVALVLIVQLFGNLLNPIILGKAVDIHPLAILVGVTGGTLVAGIFGAFVAVPFVAVLLV